MFFPNSSVIQIYFSPFESLVSISLKSYKCVQELCEFQDLIIEHLKLYFKF